MYFTCRAGGWTFLSDWYRFDWFSRQQHKIHTVACYYYFDRHGARALKWQSVMLYGSTIKTILIHLYFSNYSTNKWIIHGMLFMDFHGFHIVHYVFYGFYIAHYYDYDTICAMFNKKGSHCKAFGFFSTMVFWNMIIEYWPTIQHNSLSTISGPSLNRSDCVEKSSTSQFHARRVVEYMCFIIFISHEKIILKSHRCKNVLTTRNECSYF